MAGVNAFPCSNSHETGWFPSNGRCTSSMAKNLDGNPGPRSRVSIRRSADLSRPQRRNATDQAQAGSFGAAPAVDAQPGVVREIGTELEEERTQVFVDTVEVEMV